MRSLQSVQRRMGFETLEAKTLFAADLMGSAAIDLPDTTVVAGFEHGDVRFPYVLGYREGGENAIVGDSLLIGDHNLGGQEGEDFNNPSLGGQEDEGLIILDNDGESFTDSTFDSGDDGDDGNLGVSLDDLVRNSFEGERDRADRPVDQASDDFDRFTAFDHPSPPATPGLLEMPVPELSDSVSKHRLEHSPGMDDEIWTDGTMTNLSEFPARTSLSADRVDHNSAHSNGGIVGEGVDNVDYSTESRSDGEQHKIYDPSQCRWNDITSTEAGDGQGIGIFPIPIATPSDHVSQNPKREVDFNYRASTHLSIGSGTKAILNGSVMGDLVNNGMLIVSGDRADSVQDGGEWGDLGMQGFTYTPDTIGQWNDDNGMQGFTFEPDPGYVLDASSKDQAAYRNTSNSSGIHENQRDHLGIAIKGEERANIWSS